MRHIYLLALFISVILAACSKDDANNSMTAPVANAGPDRTLNPHMLDSCILDAGLSSDPDGVITSYQWKIIDNTNPASIVSSISARTRVDGVTTNGVYQFELTVKDNQNLIDKDTVNIQVINVPSNSVRFDSLSTETLNCTVVVPAIYSNVPAGSSLNVYIRYYWGSGIGYYSTTWNRLGTTPFPPYNPNLPPNSYGYWYRIDNGTLIIYLPGNIDCNFDPSVHDVLVKW